MSHELYKACRPQSFKQVRGQDGAVRILQEYAKKRQFPHALLFTGPSGTGKTTLARIVAAKLQCADFDVTEINCADFRGIEMVRDIRRSVGLRPMGGASRIWIIDEAHKLSNDAQNAFLKILEDTPDHAYFALCTTDPHKLIATVKTRCTEIALKAVLPQAMKQIIENALGMVADHKVKSEEVIDRIVDVAEGSPRKALVVLDQILHMEDEEEQLNCILSSDAKSQAIQVARALINPTTKWPEMAKILKTVEEDPEQIRHLVLAFARTVLLGGGKSAPRAAAIIQSFRDAFYDSKQAGLAVACYEVIAG